MMESYLVICHGCKMQYVQMWQMGTAPSICGACGSKKIEVWQRIR